MVRTSTYLRMLRVKFDAHKELGFSIMPHDLTDICEFLKICEDQCTEMEARLAGMPLPAGGDTNPKSNIVSLAQFVARRSGELFPNPTDNT
ncbi:hypothetical protein ABID16_000073 [Rhizobium aquaticum]|uniref:Uncharacterized protein n=1 Tax=Rhizobium aquaticum TaxID=1549636 RepID=A0ABV2ITJ5_9HYPH